MKILIIEDHPLMSAALAGVLQGVASHVTCLSAANGAESLQLMTQGAGVRLVVLDLALPDIDGFELIARARARILGTPILVVSASENAQDVHRAIAAGAMGYVAKSAPPALLLKAARMALLGEAYWPPDVVNAAAAATIEPPLNTLLNVRQTDVLRLMCAGKSNKFIGFELGLAEKTVKGRVTAIFKAFDVGSRTQAVLKASELGLFALGVYALDAATQASPGPQDC